MNIKSLAAKIAILLGASIIQVAEAATVTFSLCNQYGTEARSVVVKDKKDALKKIFDALVEKGSCATIHASSDDGKFAEIEVRIGQETPYSVPWIAPGDEVDF